VFTTPTSADPLQPRLLSRVLNRGGVRRSGRRWRALRRVAAALLMIAAGISATWGPPPGAGDPVLVATRDLAVGDVLTPDDLQVRPMIAPPDGALTSPDDTTGRTISGAVRRGEVLTDVRLVPISGPAPGPGRRAISVHPADAALTDLLTAGMRVAVVGVDPSGNPVPLTTDAVVLGSPPEQTSKDQPPVLLAVLIHDADRVSAATLTGEVALQWGDSNDLIDARQPASSHNPDEPTGSN